MRVHISGLYLGYYQKEDNNEFHAIQLTELDFEPKVNKIVFDEEDDDELLFGSFTSKKSSSKNKKKHDLTYSESSTDSSDKSSSSNTTQSKKKKRTSKKKKTTSVTDKVDELTTKIKHEVPYENLPAAKAIASLNDNHLPQYNPYFNNPKNIPPLNDNQPPHPYYHYPPYPYYPPPPSQSISTSEKADNKADSDKKSVQFDLNNEQDIEPTEKKGKRGARSKRGQKSKATPTRTSPRKKGGILSIAVNKVVDNDDDDDDDAHSKKSESLMDTESDYHTQNEEMNDNFEDDGSE
jgi:hypothetical protein